MQLIDIVSLFLQDCGTYCMQVKAYSIMLSPRLSVTDIICLHFCFSVSRPGVEGIYSPSISFVYMWSR